MLYFCYSFFYFFFECDGDHRDLHVLTHSVPTRRSSDLAWFIGPGSIWARRYDADGRAQGVSFRVSPANPQIVVDRPQISRNAAGDFAIAWESSGSSDLADTGVYLRLYSANGTAFGAATRIDCRRSEEHTSELQSLMRISSPVFSLK